MTATLEDVAKEKDRLESLAEQRAAEGMVRRAGEPGLSPAGLDGLVAQLARVALDRELTGHLGRGKSAPSKQRGGTRPEAGLTGLRNREPGKRSPRSARG